jgi:localization factor PodJL
MRSGGPWNLRGLRPEARAAARDAARRSGMSVGEWLNTVIRPAEANDDESWWSADVDRTPDDRYDRSEPGPRNDHPERELGPEAASPWRRRDREPEERRQSSRHDDASRERQRGGSFRRRDREPQESRRRRPRHDDETGYGDAPERSRDRDRDPEDRPRQSFRDNDRQHSDDRDVPRHRRAREPDDQFRLNFQREDRERRPADADWSRYRRDDRRDDAQRPVEREGSAYRDQPSRGSFEHDERERAERQRRERQRFEQAAATAAAAKQSRDNAIDRAVAEITARQQALDGAVAEIAPPQCRRDAETAALPSVNEPPPSAAAPAVESERVYSAWPAGWRSPGAPEAALDIGGLQEQLRQMTARIEALRPSRELETAIAGLRTDLAEIGRSVTEALPRRALESLETEVKALGQRIDHSRQAGVDAAALAGIERRLVEVRESLRGLTPAEGLVGFDEAIKALGKKVDAIVARDDPGAFQQLETAIGSLRSVVSHVASNDTLTKVAEDVRTLSAKIDGLASTSAGSPTLAALENRIDILASALNASTEAGHAVPRELEKLLSSLIEKFERVQLTSTDQTALAHLEDRIAALVKRLDASDARFGLLEGVERGLADLLVYIDQLRDDAIVGAKTPSLPRAAAREVADVRQTERQPQDGLSASLDAIQGPPGPVVDRRTTIDNDACTDRPKAVSTEPMPPPMSAPLSPAHEFKAGASAADAVISEPPARPSQPEQVAQRSLAPRTPIDPNLPPDHPLEPGSAGRSRNAQSAADRIAASEAAAGSKPPVIPDPDGGKPDFIAAARRAAQAAAAATPEGKRLARAGAEGPARPRKLTDRLRALAVAAAVIVIVVGGFHIISRLFDDSGSSMPAPVQTDPPRGQSTPQMQTEPQPAGKEPPHVEAEPPPNAASLPRSAPLTGTDTLPSPGADPNAKGADPNAKGADAKPSGQQSQLNTPSLVAMALSPSPDGKAGGRGPAAAVPMDVTSALPSASSRSPAVPHPVTPTMADRLPAAIGGSALRLAALAGDPLAAYEVGVRFSEGRGVPANNEEAARWLDIAAKKGIVPAQFRLGTLYEKGLGVKKDLAAARDLYRAAADKGHGKAMHNLAVLYAEGADGKPDYDTAARWFRKAADRGITDSQYNLAILYARGVGVEQNLAESYKWFFLAAKEGDRDAAQKRDEIASRLDPQTLAAARSAAETWTAVPQPADAIAVKGAWDSPASPPPAVKPKPRSARVVAPDATRVN